MRLQLLEAPDVGLTCILLTTQAPLWPTGRMAPLAFILLTFKNSQYGFGPYLIDGGQTIDTLVYKIVKSGLVLGRRFASIAFENWFMSSMYEADTPRLQLYNILEIVHWTVKGDWQHDDDVSLPEN